VKRTIFRYGEKNRASMRRIESLIAKTSGLYITICA
jgi:hypothetical protein